MFVINDDKSIYLTRGDIATIEISAEQSGGNTYSFQVDDVLRFRVLEKNHYDSTVMTKDVTITSETSSVDIVLDSNDTRIGAIISKPKDYWYEVELNPNTAPQIIIGYDADGPKIFRLFPEGDDTSEH